MYVGHQEIETFIEEQLPPEKYGFHRLLARDSLKRDNEGFFVVKESGIEDGYDCWDSSLHVRQAFSNDGISVGIGVGMTNIFCPHYFNVVPSPGGPVIADSTPFYRQSNGRHIRAARHLNDEEISVSLYRRRIDLRHLVPLSYRMHDGRMYFPLTSISPFITPIAPTNYGEKLLLVTCELGGSPLKSVSEIRTSIFIKPQDMVKLNGRLPNTEAELVQLIKEGRVPIMYSAFRPQNINNDGHNFLELFHKTNDDILLKLALELMHLR